MPEEPAQFYDDLANNYHLLFADWRQTTREEGETLDRIIRWRLPGGARTVLDCSCGIGTQSIGLALRGYDVTGRDVSAESVERAAREMKSFDVNVDFGVSDLRTVAADVRGPFDVVLSWDNSLPHLLTPAEIHLAVENMKRLVRPGGLILVGTRDYDRALKEHPRFSGGEVFDGPDGRRVIFQVWDWKPDGVEYELQQFLVVERAGEWKTLHYPTLYRALRRSELEQTLRSAGFTDPVWNATDESGYREPFISALAPG